MSHSYNSQKGTKHGHHPELWGKRASFAHLVGWARTKFTKVLTHRAERRAAKKQISESLIES